MFGTVVLAAVLSCDAGVFWGKGCVSPKGGEYPSPACLSGYPTGANASSSSSTLIWEKGGRGSGGPDDDGGDVFLSTTLNMGCGGGYYGSQMHWNTSSMNADWAIWDIIAGETTHPINPVDKHGNTVTRQGKPCSIVEPPPAGFEQCACSRYSGEGFGTHCGVGKDDGFDWKIGTPYTLNVSYDPSVVNNVNDSTFLFTIFNEESKELIEVGRIRTTNPSGTHGIPAGKYACNEMQVGGGSFQEFYDGGNFTSWATISGPIFRGVKGETEDVVPTGFQACCFFGNCSGGYGGCQNQTVFFAGESADESTPSGVADPGAGCSKEPTAGKPTCGYKGLPAVSFKGGDGQPVGDWAIPPWYHWASEFNADGSAGPDGGTLPESASCAFNFHTNRGGGLQAFSNWAHIPYPGSQPYSMPQNCVAEGKNAVGRCSRLCCAYCLADKDCVSATLVGTGCNLIHADPKQPFGPWNNASAGITSIIPKRS